METWGERVFLQLVERVSSERDFANWLRLWSTSDPQLLAHAVYAYTRLLDYLCSHHYVMTEDGREAIVHPPEVFHRLIGAERPTIQKAAYDMLVSANEPRDDWHREAVIARILCPRLAMFAVSLPWWLNPPGPGMTEIERQQGTMTAAPDRVERHATRMKREALKLQDWEPARAKPGPKPTSSRRVNPDKQAFDEAMVKKQRQHVSPAMTVEDADVQRLYRAWRGEGAIATEETVRRVLRSQNRVH